jgi:hypothetical protein
MRLQSLECCLMISCLNSHKILWRKCTHVFASVVDTGTLPHCQQAGRQACRQAGALAHSCLSSGTAVVAAAGPNLGFGFMPLMFILTSVAMLRNIKKLLRKTLNIRAPLLSESAENLDTKVYIGQDRILCTCWKLVRTVCTTLFRGLCTLLNPTHFCNKARKLLFCC